MLWKKNWAEAQRSVRGEELTPAQFNSIFQDRNACRETVFYKALRRYASKSSKIRPNCKKVG